MAGLALALLANMPFKSRAPIRLALDAVSGQATARLADCVADGGTVCTYGSMTGEDPVVARGVDAARRGCRRPSVVSRRSNLVALVVHAQGPACGAPRSAHHPHAPSLARACGSIKNKKKINFYFINKIAIK